MSYWCKDGFAPFVRGLFGKIKKWVSWVFVLVSISISMQGKETATCYFTHYMCVCVCAACQIKIDCASNDSLSSSLLISTLSDSPASDSASVTKTTRLFWIYQIKFNFAFDFGSGSLLPVTWCRLEILPGDVRIWQGCYFTLEWEVHF